MNRVLIVRLGALGDVVHAIPVAAALRRAFPAARIDWLVSARHREILDLVPVINTRLSINDRGDASHGSGLLETVREMRRARYDVAIDLQGLLKSAMLARSAGAKTVLGFSSRYTREPLARAFYTDAYNPGRGGMYAADETRHVVQINLGLLERLGVRVDAPEFPIAPVDSEVARRVQAQAGGRYAILNPGAAWPNKRWPPLRLAAVAEMLERRHGLKSIALWGPGEKPLAEEIVARAGGAALLPPQTSMIDLVALARGAALMVSGDTGPTHIAAAVGTPLVALFGPTRPVRNGPWSPADVMLSRDTICQCHHLRQCRLASMCLLDIHVEEVADAVERRLSAGALRG